MNRPGCLKLCLEAAYAGHLRTLILAGEVLHYEFEPLKLRLADKTFYNPDFMVVRRDGLIDLHEVKGSGRMMPG